MPIDQHEVRVTTLAGVELDIIGGATITADRGWSPHVQARIPIAPPSTDLTTGRRILIELTQRTGSFCFTRDMTELHGGGTSATLTTAYGGGTSATLTALVTAGSWNTPMMPASGRTFDLMVTKINKSRTEWTLELASVEAAYIDAIVAGSGAEGSATIVDGNNTIDMVRFWHQPNILAYPWTYANDLGFGAFADLTVPSLVTQAFRSGLGAPLSVPTLTNMWAAVVQTLVSVGQRLFSRGDWALIHSQDVPTASGEITVTDGVNLIDWEYTDKLPGYAYVRWTGDATNPAARPIHSDAPSLTLYPHTRVVEVPTALVGWPRTGVIGTPWDTPATAYSDRAGLDESPLRLVAISDYSVMPWSSINYTLPDEAEETTIIDAITWYLDRHQMDIWV